MQDQHLPFENLEGVIASICHTLLAKGMERHARLVSEADIALKKTGRDNWDGGTDVWELQLSVSYPEFTALQEPEVAALEAVMQKVVDTFLPKVGHWVTPKLYPRTVDDPDWRKVIAMATGTAATNQGRAHSKNPASLEHDGLLFRSKPEVYLYDALKATGVPFAPLPVFIRGGKRFSRVEPDFVLIKDGVVIFAEVDGTDYHRESPADAHYRLKPFQDEGVHVERVKAEHCNTPERAGRFGGTGK